MVTKIVKRNYSVVDFDIDKIRNAIAKAYIAIGYDIQSNKISTEINSITENVKITIDNKFIEDYPKLEEIQDIIESSMMIICSDREVVKAYIRYRSRRNSAREMDSELMSVYSEIHNKDSNDSDLLRDNANIDGDGPMGKMLKYAAEGAKYFYENYIIKPKYAKAHKDGYIHIHDEDFYGLTTTCCQIGIRDLFRNGFSTGHGTLREPNSIMSYSALAAIAIQANQNDQHKTR